jgi:hypothetical protein
MSRSLYIYIVSYDSTHKPIAVFTVKHEMVTWLKTKGNAGMIAYRMYDGGARDTRPTVYWGYDELVNGS